MWKLWSERNWPRIATAGRAVLVAVGLVALGSCADPNAVVRLDLSMSATLETDPFASGGLARLTFVARNDGSSVVYLSGCPNAPAYYLDAQLASWYEVASVGVVCPANLVSQRIALAPREQVSRSFTVATPGTYRFRLLVDDPNGGSPRVLTSNALAFR